MIFVDSSYWLALRHRRDAHHQAAAQLWQTKDTALVTTNHVVGESWTYGNRKFGHAWASTLVTSLSASASVDVVHVGEQREAEAWKWLAQHDEREYSFVDATSFAVMRALGITDAFAFDADFTAAGFVELRP